MGKATGKSEAYVEIVGFNYPRLREVGTARLICNVPWTIGRELTARNAEKLMKLYNETGHLPVKEPANLLMRPRLQVRMFATGYKYIECKNRRLHLLESPEGTFELWASEPSWEDCAILWRNTRLRYVGTYEYLKPCT